jgi:hypothetical protein
MKLEENKMNKKITLCLFTDDGEILIDNICHITHCANCDIVVTSGNYEHEQTITKDEYNFYGVWLDDVTEEQNND